MIPWLAAVTGVSYLQELSSVAQLFAGTLPVAHSFAGTRLRGAVICRNSASLRSYLQELGLVAQLFAGTRLRGGYLQELCSVAQLFAGTRPRGAVICRISAPWRSYLQELGLVAQLFAGTLPRGAVHYTR